MLKNIKFYCLCSTLILTACTNNNGAVNNSKTTQNHSVENAIDIKTSDSVDRNCKIKNQYTSNPSDNVRPIQVTPAQKRKPTEYLNREKLMERLKKYNLYERIDGINGISESGGILVEKGDKDNSKIYITIGSYGIIYIQYDFLYAQNTHQISKDAKSDIIKLINIVIDNDQKAHQLFDELYQQYQDNLRNNNILENNMVVADVEYSQRLFELQGTVYKDKDNPNCNISRIETLIIN